MRSLFTKLELGCCVTHTLSQRYWYRTESILFELNHSLVYHITRSYSINPTAPLTYVISGYSNQTPEPPNVCDKKESAHFLF